ncbi:MAG: DUF3047 domain-containing protein [Pseudomonadota bacterium]|nr:DUF3047 domain-containing protein [Pseudomonadota bacterium]
MIRWWAARLCLCVLVSMLLSTGPRASEDARSVVLGRFVPEDLSRWGVRSFAGQTVYRLAGEDELPGTLLAQCDASASALYLRQRVDLRKTPVLNWSWRVDQPFEGLDEQTKGGDDYAARVYVVYGDGWRIWRTRAINYAWTGSEPAGRHWPNAFTDQAMMVAVRSGPSASTDGWYTERRDVRADFRRYFNMSIEQIDGVAIMTDCDNAGGQGVGRYRNIYFSAE